MDFTGTNMKPIFSGYPFQGKQFKTIIHTDQGIKSIGFFHFRLRHLNELSIFSFNKIKSKGFFLYCS